MEDIKTKSNLYLTEDDESLQIASKCWERVMNAASKTGYREGVQDGADSVLQEGFDIGFKDGFETAFTLGKYKSLAATLSSTSKHPTDIAAILEKTRRGACHICSAESQNPNIHDMPFSEILKDQKTHSTKVINRLHEYFEPILNNSNIGINFK
nr:PREDICTED: yae1 domain-containing protein 1 [Linepithema humile]